MSRRTSETLRVWRARRARTTGDRAYLAYMALMVVVIAVLPLARAVWLGATSPAVVATLLSPHAPAVTMISVTALWAGALLVGRDRGPALLPPFLTFTFAGSDLAPSDTFRRPVLSAVAAMTALTALVFGLTAGSLLSVGHATPLDVLSFTAAGGLVGTIATVAWLAGQVFPRVASPLALGVLTLGSVTVAFPVVQPFTPWGWVGLVFPGVGPAHSLVGLIALTLALVAAIPSLMNRLVPATLMPQALRWNSATTHAMGMDVGAAAEIYQARPHLGRRLRAVRPWRSRAAVFLVRDAVGAARTPGRLIVGLLALIAAGVCVTLSFAPALPGWAWGAVAGLVLFAGLGPLTDGVRHAVRSAADLPVYGLSDERLLAHHALFPLAVTVILLLAVVVTCSLILGSSVLPPLCGSTALALLALTARAGTALKGPMPPILLSPISTPIGDLGVAARLMWAFDGVLSVTLLGIAVAWAPRSPVLLLVVAVAITAVAALRWRRRA